MLERASCGGSHVVDADGVGFAVLGAAGCGGLQGRRPARHAVGPAAGEPWVGQRRHRLLLLLLLLLLRVLLCLLLRLLRLHAAHRVLAQQPQAAAAQLVM
jgi:hypothetical protein